MLKENKPIVQFVSKNYFETIKEVKNKIKSNGYCILRNFQSKNDNKKILRQIKKNYKKFKDVKHTGDQKLFDKDFQRLDLGNSYQNPRFLRVMSFYEWNKKNSFFFNIINPAIKFRNTLCNLFKDKFVYPEVKPIEKKLINKKYTYAEFVRMIQYPKGGGFLSEHHDYTKYYAKGVLGMLLPITFKKNGSFEEGGLYFKINRKKIYIDDFVKLGDLILFNPKIKHGVLSVNPRSPTKLNSIQGRLTIAFSISKYRKR